MPIFSLFGPKMKSTDSDIVVRKWLANFFVLFLQSAWCLKTRALTEQVYVDEVDVDEQGIAEMLMDDNAVAQLPR